MATPNPKTENSKTTYRKKLIEVALPLQAINKASAREKSIRHGHPSTLHLWWARRPLAACRAVLFSSLVNDPGDDPMYGISEDIAATERTLLFNLIEDLVLWENSNNPTVINKARLEIARSIAANKVADGELDDDTNLVAEAPELPEEQAKYLPDPPPEYTPHQVRFKMPGLKSEQVNHFLAHYAPPVLDPFAGGGSIPLEAQRLGLRANASDLNPVPVLINKALIEIPPKFAGQPPVNPNWQSKTDNEKTATVWEGANGLAEDVRYYGKWMRDEAEKRIGHLYPKIKVTQEMVDDGRPDLEPHVGRELTVIAWLWARTARCPNPACGDQMPLVRSFCISKKSNKPEVWLQPNANGGFFRITNKNELDFEGTIKGRTAHCLSCGTIVQTTAISEFAKSNGLGVTLNAIVASTDSGRVYLAANATQQAASQVVPDWKPEQQVTTPCHDVDRLPMYGMPGWSDAFTNRQLQLLTMQCDLIQELKIKIAKDAETAGNTGQSKKMSDAIATFVALGLNRTTNTHCTLGVWSTTRDQSINAFGRQAIGMTWDFPEVNPFAGAAGDLGLSCNSIAKVIERLPSGVTGHVQHATVRDPQLNSVEGLVSTDPPYYDNITYSELSDFFYVWLRRSLSPTYPSLFSTMLTPKSEELIAAPFRFGGDRNKAKQFFEEGLGDAFVQINKRCQADFPLSIYYAFKQTESSNRGNSTSSTGWETFLTAVLKANFSITGTWPMRTERDQGLKSGTNVLASSIILVCNPREENALMISRRDFAKFLRKELPEAIKHLQSGSVAPVDLAQASIGPGMAVFSRYSKVVNADGSPMSVREALQLINQVLDESLVEQESDFDSDTRFALRWYDQYGMDEGPFGDAEVLAKAMAVSVSGVVEAGIVKSGAGKVRLLKREELNEKWTPAADARLTMWEATQYLIRRLESEGEQRTAELLVELIELKGSEYAESVRELSYRLYQTCDRAKRAEEARSYNGLVVSWPEIFKLAMQYKNSGKATESQTEMFDD